MTAVDEVKVCSKCERAKPVGEFYPHARGKFGVGSHCRDCENTRPRHTTEGRVARVRGRHRATRELIARHKDEFDHLLDYFTRIAQDELAAIAARADASPAAARRDAKTAELPRLRPGPARAGQSVLDRIDERARCVTCRDAHDRGHVCPSCGAAPDAPRVTPMPPAPVVKPGPPAAAPPAAVVGGQVTSPLCACGHPGRRHDDGLCLVCDECTGFTDRTAVA